MTGKTVYSYRGIHINLSTTDKAKVVIKGAAPGPNVGDVEVVHSEG